MHDMLKRHEVQVLRRAGHSQAEVARLTGLGERSVRRIEAEPEVVSVETGAERKARKIGRPSKAEAFRSFVVDLLEEDPELLTLELLRRARLKGYKGAKSAFYTLVAAVRRPKPAPVVRFEGLPGEFTQHDFGHVDVRFIDDTKRRVHFFASRLKYSRWVEVTLVPNERVESLVRPMVDHFFAMGGVPLLAVFDRPKTIALSWRKDGTVTEWNSTFGSVMLELGVGVELCWPRRANQKGSVENLVGWVKGSFFKQRRFVDDADLLQQLKEWLVEVNNQRPCRATGAIPAQLRAEEQPRLRPLKVKPEELALRFPVYVGPTAMVLHDTHEYSMPSDAMSFAATLYLLRDTVRIVAGRFTATHPRLFEPGAKSVLPEHRAQQVAAVSAKRGQRYLKRQHLLECGSAALEYLTEITHRRPRDWIGEVDQLFELLQAHGPGSMRLAFERAIAEGAYGAEYVRHFLCEHLLSMPDRAPQGASL